MWSCILLASEDILFPVVLLNAIGIPSLTTRLEGSVLVHLLSPGGACAFEVREVKLSWHFVKALLA